MGKERIERQRERERVIVCVIPVLFLLTLNSLHVQGLVRLPEGPISRRRCFNPKRKDAVQDSFVRDMFEIYSSRAVVQVTVGWGFQAHSVVSCVRT